MSDNQIPKIILSNSDIVKPQYSKTFIDGRNIPLVGLVNGPKFSFHFWGENKKDKIGSDFDAFA